MKKWSAIATMVFALGVLTITWSLPQSATADEQARLTGNENHNIELLDAQQMIHHFQMNNPEQDVVGGYFGKAAFQRILNQDGCVGIRYYFGISEDGHPNLVLVGVDKLGNDLVKGELAERSLPCPPMCGDLRLDEYVAPQSQISQR